MRILPTIALAIILPSISANAAETSQKENQKSLLGWLDTNMLADDSVNELTVPVPPGNLDSPLATLKWDEKHTIPCLIKTPGPQGVNVDISSMKRSTNPDKARADEETRLSVKIPKTTCRLWPYQNAHLTIKALVAGKSATLFEQDVRISPSWFPLATTLLALAFIYPGCAWFAFYKRRHDYEKDFAEAVRKGQRLPETPTLLGMLDPVQITANPVGRGSLGKLQIFMFSFLVFGLLLFYLLRYGILSNISTDVMYLLGVSAIGAVGGKLAYIQTRRLSLENWAWLRRKAWLSFADDKAPRAKWRELFVDPDIQEFDPYSFQMAIFSVVVAVALMISGFTGIGTFKIPLELLTLLGISQVVYVGGKASTKTGYAELDRKLDEVRRHEASYLDLKDAPDEKERGKAVTELRKFHESALEAAEMFWTVYIEKLDARPEATKPDAVRQMMPDLENDAQPPPPDLKHQ
jgi:hypothetical protein